ncbi:hypothetical protein [Polaribacter sp.]|uniref:hypothetical protein n=1 Tax=Polaribacter sp. TaxID=1920175 RepID=UPI003EF81C68
MKAFKIFLVFLMVSFSIWACSSNDIDDLVAAIKQEIGISLNLDDLANLTGTDATNIVTFSSGVPAANHITYALIGDEISFDIQTISANSMIRISDFSLASGDEDLWQNGLEKVIDTGYANPKAYFKVLEAAKEGQEVKFDITFFVTTNGIIDQTLYTIDPKIRIRARR